MTNGLRVTDNTSAVFPQTGLPDLTDEDTAAVSVFNVLIDDLEARPKDRKIQLTWSAIGDEVAVLRSELSANQGFVEIARTTNTYATYLDETVELNTDYYYRIFVYEAGNTNPIGVSSAEFANSPGLDSGNRAPRLPPNRCW